MEIQLTDKPKPNIMLVLRNNSRSAMTQRVFTERFQLIETSHRLANGEAGYADAAVRTGKH